MTRTLSILAALVAAFGVAHAQAPRVLKVLETSYELGLGEVVAFPDSTNGTIIVKPCAECPRATHRVSATTIYLLNRTPVSLDDFLAAVTDRQKARGANTAVGVYLDIDTKRVNRILLSYSAR